MKTGVLCVGCVVLGVGIGFGVAAFTGAGAKAKRFIFGPGNVPAKG